MMTTLIRVLGSLVALVMGMGAVFAALNTMYSAVAERSREIATIRALGFGAGASCSPSCSRRCWSRWRAACSAAWPRCPLNGLTTSTMNFQTFSHLSFAFRITPPLLALGVAFALLMGLVGGVPPAIRAARLPVAAALRDLWRRSCDRVPRAVIRSRRRSSRLS